MGLKLAVLVAVLVDMKVESTTLPCSFLLTYIFESRILIWVREIPDCIKFHLSFCRIDSTFRCSLDMKGLTLCTRSADLYAYVINLAYAKCT